MNYQSKNNANAIWLLPIILLIFDFFIIGGDISSMGYIIWPTIIGGGIGALTMWAGNKDMSISIVDNKLILKKNLNEVREYNKEEINTYRVSKDQGKTVIRISGNDKSEYELASYFLDLNGFEESMKEFLK